jgi:hypothetical protein
VPVEIYGHQGKGVAYEAFRPILDGWHEAMRRYSRIHHDDDGDDAGYFTNERANISFLAAGAWIAGFGALEEYVSPKYKSRKKKSGRVDLYLCKTKEENAEVEAKIKWLNAHFGNERLAKHVVAALRLAVGDAKAVRGSENRYGCVFFVPMFKPKPFKNFKKSHSASIKAVVERVCQCDRSAIWAWSFPSQTRDIVEKKIYYPGVIMGIKSV